MVGDGGSYSFGTQAPAVSGSTVFDGVQVLLPSSSTMDPANPYVEDINSVSGGLMENVSIANVTLTVDSTGRFTFNDGSNKVGYMVAFNGNGEFTHSVAIDAGAGDATPTIIINDRGLHQAVMQ
jgi:hypothetical protein